MEKIVKTASKVSVKSQVDSDDEELDDESRDEDNLMGDEEVGAMSGESGESILQTGFDAASLVLKGGIEPLWP